MSESLEITPEDLQTLLAAPEPPILLDVRKAWEHAHSHIEGSVLIPLDALPSRVGEIERGRPIVVYCHHGMRSLHGTHWLRGAGFDARSLRGGIELWAATIDKSIPRY